MEDNLSITQHIIPNIPIKPSTPYTPPQPQYAQPQYMQPQYIQQQYTQPQYTQPQYTQPQYMHSQYNQSQSPIKNPLVGALIGLACIIVVLIILLICSIMGIIKNGGSSSSNSNSSSGGKNSRGNNNQFKNKHKQNQNDPSGWQLYTLKGCGHCDEQLKDLKNFNTYVKYERGNPNPIVNNISGELYPREKINGFPLWYNSQTKEVKMGHQKNICNLNPKIKSENC